MITHRTDMRMLLLAIAVSAMSVPALAQERRADDPVATTTPSAEANAVVADDQVAVPEFEVDPFWPKPLPNNWLLGQVSGVAVDKRDHIWVIHRPRSLSEREVGSTLNPPISKCCTPAPPVLVFDVSGNLLRYWGGEGQGTSGRITSTASLSTTTISYGSAATTMRTTRS